MNGSDRDRLRPPPSSTPMRQPDAALAKPRAESEGKKMGPGAGPAFSGLRVHADEEQASPILAGNASLATGMSTGNASLMSGMPGSPRNLALGGSMMPVAAPLAINPNSWSETIDTFTHNGATLTSKHGKTIDALAAAIAARLGLVANGRATVAITGHTDTSGDEKYNQDLGLKRADAAKVALLLALAKQRVGADKTGAITTNSLGETSLAKPTDDNVKEPLNRRVEIVVTIEGPPPSASATTPQIRSPDAPEEEKKPIDLNLPKDYKLPEERGPRRPPQEDDWWKRAEKNQRQIDEYDKAHPRTSKSLTDVLVEGVTKALDPLLKKLPKSLRDKAREGIRKGIEAGTQNGCEAAIDASGVSGADADALKAACKAALNAKPEASK